MKRNNTLYLIIGLLVVGIGLVSFFWYQERHRSGIDVEVNDQGLSVETH
jgi:hypothetical protein